MVAINGNFVEMIVTAVGLLVSLFVDDFIIPLWNSTFGFAIDYLLTADEYTLALIGVLIIALTLYIQFR